MRSRTRPPREARSAGLIRADARSRIAQGEGRGAGGEGQAYEASDLISFSSFLTLAKEITGLKHVSK